MNDRIRELARDAGIKMDHADTLALGYIDTAHKKFAESIIRECLYILDDEDDGSYGGRGVRIAAHRIKQHFGFE